MDSDSDSSWNLGTGSTGENKISCKKLKINHDLENYTNLGLINTTNILIKKLIQIYPINQLILEIYP